MKQKITLILYAALLAFTLSIVMAGCRGENPGNQFESEPPQHSPDTTAEDSEDAEPADPSGGNSVTDTDVSGIDYNKAFAALAPDTVMVKAGALTVTWEELFLYLYGNINGIVYNTGMIPPWSEMLYDDVTFAEAILELSVENAVFYKSIEYGAAQAGISLSEEDMERIRLDFEEACDMYGGEEEFLKLLWAANGCQSRELFEYLSGIGALANHYFAMTYGEACELLSDEDVEEYIKDEGYMMAKHILRRKPDEGDDTALKEIEDILSSLENYNGNDVGEYFDELMREHTEDNLSMFPNGYLFVYSDMVSSFSEACSKLDAGQFSGIVESEFGYHIIYRLPIDYNEVPLSNSSQGDYSSLRRIAAMGLFDSVMSGWADSLDVVSTAELDALDLSEIFK